MGRFIGTLGRAIAASGRAIAWLTLVMVVATFAIVVMRYGFSLGWIWLQESVTYLHAMVFMLAAAWTLQEDGHVRVDIFYRDRKPHHKALINLLGTVVFLIPFCVFLLVVGWEYVQRSWHVLEGSREAGGLPLVYVLKTLILLLPVMLLAQAACGVRDAADAWRRNRRARPAA